MTNLEVAKMYVGNALAYARDFDIRRDTIISNLEYIEELLQAPHAENLNHDWDEFK